jgi:hypothetical protein
MVSAKLDASKEKQPWQIASTEYFHDVQVKTDSLDEVLPNTIHSKKYDTPFSADWIQWSGESAWRKGSCDTLDIKGMIVSLKPWQKVTVSFTGDSLSVDSTRCSPAFLVEEETLSYTWLFDPADTLSLQARIFISSNGGLVRTINATYPFMPFDIVVKADYANLVYKTTIAQRDTLARAVDSSD